MKPFVSVQDSRQVGYVGKAGWNHAALLRLGVVASPGSLRGEPGCGQQGWCCRSTGQQGLSRLCAYSLPPTESSRQHTCVEKRARGPRSELSFHLRQCCGWFDLLSRPLKLFPLSAVRLLHIFTIYVFSGVALLISFKNFFFAFTTWLFGTRPLVFGLSWLSTCLPH